MENQVTTIEQSQTLAKETVLRGVITNPDTGEKRATYARIPIIFTPLGFATQYAYRAMSERYGADDPKKYNDDYKVVFEDIRSDFLEGVAFARKRIEMKIGERIKL